MNDMSQGYLTDEPIALDDTERQPCEVWTRVMGYHRPVSSFNIGKKGEHYERRFFEECPPAAAIAPARSCVSGVEAY